MSSPKSSRLPKSISLPTASTWRRTSTPAATFAASASRKVVPIVARLVAVDQQVDMIRRGLDVGQHPREVAVAVEQRLHARRRSRGKVHREVMPADPLLGQEPGGAASSLPRLDRTDGVRTDGVLRKRAVRTTDTPGEHHRGRRRTEADQEPAHAHRPGFLLPHILRSARVRRPTIGVPLHSGPRCPCHPRGPDTRRAARWSGVSSTSTRAPVRTPPHRPRRLRCLSYESRSSTCRSSICPRCPARTSAA